MMHCIRDRGGETGQTDFADAAGAEFVYFCVGIIKEVHVQRRDIRIHRHHVVSEIAVDRRAGLLVVCRVFEQRHANPHHHRTFNLIAAGKRIENASCINHAHHSADAQAGDLRLPRDLDEVTAE